MCINHIFLTISISYWPQFGYIQFKIYSLISALEFDVKFNYFTHLIGFFYNNKLTFNHYFYVYARLTIFEK